MIKLSDVLVDRAKTPFAVRRNKPSVIWRTTGENQAAYRIGVAKSRYKAINGQFDVYDSGVTESGETIGHAVGAELDLVRRIMYPSRFTAKTAARIPPSSVSVPNFPLRIGKDIGRLCR